MKKLASVLAIGALVVSMAGASLAANVDININGASAQSDFWSAVAVAFLTSAAGANCTGGTAGPITFTPADNTPSGVYWHGAKYVVVEGNGPCNFGVAAGQKVTIRVGAYDSVDGVMSALGTTNPVDIMQCTGGNRVQLNNVAGGAGANNIACYPTTLGAADVNGSTIIQQSEGQFGGPAGPVSPINGFRILVGGAAGGAIPADLGDFSYTPPTIKTCGTAALTDHHPFIVPFAFFANTGAAAIGDGLLAANLTNITKTMAQQIFSGAVTDWHTFFPAIPANTPITTCLRVAGSGTYATFDAAIMRTNGATTTSLPTYDVAIGGTNAWFNNTSGQMFNCISTIPGAIGFADADKGLSTNMYRLPLNGVVPSAAAISNGTYDGFWTLEHIFEPQGASRYSGYPTAAVNSLVLWSKTNVPAGKAGYWVNSASMGFHKVSDFVSPPQIGPYVDGVCYE